MSSSPDPSPSASLVPAIVAGAIVAFTLFGCFTFFLGFNARSLFAFKGPSKDKDSGSTERGSQTGKEVSGDPWTQLSVAVAFVAEVAAVAFIGRVIWSVLAKDKPVASTAASAVTVLSGLTTATTQMWAVGRAADFDSRSRRKSPLQKKPNSNDPDANDSQDREVRDKTEDLTKGLIGITSFFVVSQLVASITVGVLFSKTAGQLEVFNPASPLSIAIAVQLSLALLADFFIVLMTAIVFKLSPALKTLPFCTTTKRRLRLLILWTVENALVTTVCTLVNLVVFFALGDYTVHLAFQFAIGRVYAVVLIFTVHRRRMHRQRKDADSGVIQMGLEIRSDGQSRVVGEPLTFANDASVRSGDEEIGLARESIGGTPLVPKASCSTMVGGRVSRKTSTISLDSVKTVTENQFGATKYSDATLQ